MIIEWLSWSKGNITFTSYFIDDFLELKHLIV